MANWFVPPLQHGGSELWLHTTTSRAARWCSGYHCRLTARRFWVWTHRPTGGPSVWSLHVLLVPAWVFPGCSRFLPQSKDMQVRFIGGFKLLVDVCVSGCLTGNLSKVYPAACPTPAGIGSSTPATLLRISGIDNGWMDGQLHLKE